MAKGVGLDAGEFEIKIVELDGSFKRPRLAKVSIDRVSQPDAHVDESHAAREAEATLHALKDAKISSDNVILGFPCRETVLRTIDVKFRGVETIRKVIKFEVEDSIHSHNVDDMVVDFHVLEELESGTRVLVAAVPKQPLRITLQALGKLGIDPEFVDLDTMALYRVAVWAGCFESPIALAEADGAIDDVAGAVVEGGGSGGAATAVASVAPPETVDTTRRVRVVMDVGGRSTRVLAVAGRKIVDMRALRVGVDSIAEDVAAAKQIDLPTAREAVHSVIESGRSFAVRGEDDADVVDIDVDDAEVVLATDPEALVISATEVSAAATELLRRLHRELMRFVASMQSVEGVEAVFVTGGGSFLPGLNDVVRDVFGCAPRPLPLLENLNHNLDEDEARWIEPRIAVAVGLALGTMGGVAMLQFRQEDLGFQRRFDRIKFPLAIACLLAMFLLFIFGWRKSRQVDLLATDYGKVYSEERTSSGRGTPIVKAELFGFAGNLLNEKARYSCIKMIDRKAYQELISDVLKVDTFDRLQVIHDYLKRYLANQQKATGIYEDLQLPSGYLALAQFAEVVRRVEGELGSFIVTDMSVDMDSRNPNLEFTIAIRGDDHRVRFARLKSAIEAEFTKPGSHFKAFAQKQRDEDVWQTVEPQGAFNTLKVELKEALL